MKKMMIAVFALVLLLPLVACQSKAFADADLDVPAMKITSTSIDGDGNLLTVCAANKSLNEPKGENQSPAVSWDAVEGAACYVVVMFDETANWLHWVSEPFSGVELDQGAFMSTDTYVGPYPPKSSGRHQYRIEVFALKIAPDAVIGKLDAANVYADIVGNLDKSGGAEGNILARGYVLAAYEHGDSNA